jgi:hypothetical protein
VDTVGRRLLDRSIRISAIIVVCATMLWLGLALGPRNSDADVYWALTDGAMRRQSTEVASPTLRTMTLTLNGIAVEAERIPSSLSPEQAIVRVQAESGAVPTGWRELHAGDNAWRLYGRAPLPSFEPNRDDAEGSTAATGAWVAFAMNTGQGTDLWRMRYPEGVDVTALLTGQDMDAGGEDMPWLPRPPGARRLLTMVIPGTPPTQMLVYGCDLSVAQRTVHYRRALEAVGFSQGMQLADGMVLDFERGADRLTVLMAPRRADGSAVDVIQIRVADRG